MEKKRDVVWLTGKTGSGKSVMLRRILERSTRFIVLDTMKEYYPFPALYVHSFQELGKYLAANGSGPFRVVLDLPNALDPIEYPAGSGEFVSSCELLCRIVYEGLTGAAVVIEELGKYETRRATAPWLYNIICLGRHKALSVYATSQRPAQIHPDFKAQVTRLICFKQHLQNDLDGLEYCIGDKKEAETLRDLDPFVYGRPMVPGKHYKEYLL